MAALEADLAPEPQAGMAQFPASISSTHLYQHPSPLSAVSVSITAHVKLMSCIGGLLLSAAACKCC